MITCIISNLFCVLPALAFASDALLSVKTRTGSYVGLRNQEFPAVREFRNIPFAKAPVGKLRFQPPQPLPSSSELHYSYRFPPSCPQFLTSEPTFWNLFVPELLVENGQQNQSSGLPVLESAEDCLSLAVWTPYGISPDANLPVALFMTGGGFYTGGVNIRGQLPQQWVNRTAAHIVVTINYRVNIFGFPNAAGGSSPNLGILDQRAALEWVAENIAQFGGDPNAIMIWGQSAGSISVDYHNYAFWDNPISRASFSQSGAALIGASSADKTHSNFTFVAKQFGCDFPTDPAAELECMQEVPAPQIEEFIGTYASSPSIAFGPIIDEVLVFSDYPARVAAGKISRSPAIFSDAANEFSTLAAWPSSNASAGPYQPAINEATLAAFVCPVANTSRLRASADLLTYRFQFAGSFSNRDPYSWLGAYHSSDLYMMFGTYTINITGATEGPTGLEIATSASMQDYVFAFLSDPVNGPKKMGWEPYTYGGQVLRFGADGKVVQDVSGYEIDGPCFGNGTYNPFP